MLLHLSPAESRTVRDALTAAREEQERTRDAIASSDAERELASMRISLIDDVLTRVLERIQSEAERARRM